MGQKMDVGDAQIALAASLVDRAYDLISDGWVKGRMNTTAEGTNAPDKFCILGALQLALEEMFPGRECLNHRNVMDIAVKFILDEAHTRYNHTNSSIPSFNDADVRKEEEVLNVLYNAAHRLWSLSVDWENITEDFKFSKWADVDTESVDSQNYLNAVLA